MEEAHAALGELAAPIGGNSATLRNGISSHRIKSPLAFPVLDTFAQRAGDALPAPAADRLFLGSLDGRLVVSARLRVDPPAATATATAEAPRRKKRARDDCSERARRAVATIRARADTPELRAAVDLAEATIEALLRAVRGPAGEELFEACGLSMAVAQQTVASATAPAANLSNQRPRLIIAARLATGVPVPLLKLRRALGECFKDGMITTDASALGPAYQLPLSAAGQAVEETGQRSILLFAAVPT